MMKNINISILISALLFISCKNGDTSQFQVKFSYKNGDQWITSPEYRQIGQLGIP